MASLSAAHTRWSDSLAFLRLMADETRLQIVRALALTDLRAGEIGALVCQPSNAVSYHLKRLRAVRLLSDRQSSADARDVYYHLDIARLHELYAAAGDALYPGLVEQMSMSMQSGGEADARLDAREQKTGQSSTSASRPLRVLFLCTHNSARSQIAEALMRSMGGDQVEVYSAGSAPTEVHPEALATLQEVGVDTSGLYAKSMEQFIGESFDYIVTVCDRVRDIRRAFQGDPAQAHWSIADPVAIEDPERRAKAFRDTLTDLQTRIRYLLLLPHPGTGERLWRARPVR
jgi:protein-tyrosine-phosphatase/DNA-binding transcriptional ArsR family regulator